MKDMLDRLSQADPNAFATYAKLMRDCNMFIDVRIRPAILQAVLQEAITSRGWLWSLSAEDKGHPLSIAGTPYTCHLWDEDINEMVMDVSGESPAQALLEAYLSAIEVQA
ncbi:hypothetical protein M0R72_21000 [Candidatus Pacearchaeota archaeon]|jgi:hypothetical protein|nr:hypothetical protein [Candidatus Pacearchaeota archaeon]